MTVRQVVAPDEAAARWRAVAAATGPADRPAVERAVGAAYRAAGLPEPAAVVWFDSPLSAAAAALVLRGAVQADDGWFAEAARRVVDEAVVEAVARLVGAGVELRGGAVPVREAVRTAPWERVRRAVHQDLGPHGWTELWAATGGTLGPAVRVPASRIRDAVLDRLTTGPTATAEERAGVRLALLDAVLGQHDAPWLAAFDAAGALDGPDGSDGLAALAEVAAGAGWWWPYDRVALVAERPVVLHRDEAGRLDRADGPALAFADGFALHAWRGMPVPPDFLAGLAGLDTDRIRTEENAELRRVMLEHYGYDRYLAESGAEPLHRDETGKLWRIRLPGDEPVLMVEVVNSTAEPDGTFRTYWLRVPPDTRTARAGVAWTFGLREEEYRPQRET
ncbi:DUF6745 domain-containing protein [Kitasatospora camelliae]|uniref:DUF6745 domain-containing protein n=1 Tax=Kitasatospora camelliae TaxID=3156397 RepID=A0AAU8JZI9_9ACTN